MKDAELMTTTPDVPGLEVRKVLDGGMWSVWVDGQRLTGLVFLKPNGCYFATVSPNESPECTDRNTAVKWLMDQHK